MENTVALIMGDPSRDGHGHTELITIKSNLTKDEISLAYIAGTALMGFNFKEECCAEYEDYTISQPYVAKICEMGGQDLFALKNIPSNEDDFDLDDDDEEFACDTDLFVDVYLRIVKVGEPKFEYQLLQDRPLFIGGYGLFNG